MLQQVPQKIGPLDHSQTLLMVPWTMYAPPFAMVRPRYKIILSRDLGSAYLLVEL